MRRQPPGEERTWRIEGDPRWQISKLANGQAFVEGPTILPADNTLRGLGWLDAATVEVIPASHASALQEPRNLWRCSTHGTLEPRRFDSDWPADTGYPVQLAEQGITHPCPILGSDENECCEQMEPVASALQDELDALQFRNDELATEIRVTIETLVRGDELPVAEGADPTKPPDPNPLQATIDRLRAALKESPNA